MTYVERLVALDRRLHMRLPMAPIRTVAPTDSEERLRAVLRQDGRQGHTQSIAGSVGVSPA